MAICTVVGCDNDIKARGLCDMHLQRDYRTGIVGGPKASLPKKLPPFKTKECNAAGCNDIGIRMGLCLIHLKEFKLEK